MKLKRQSLLFFSGCLLFIGTVGASYGQEDYARERYQVIVDRAPFGTAVAAEPVIVPGGTAPVEVIQDLQQQVRLNFLLESEDEGTIKAGFQILRPAAGQPKSFVLEEGENFQQMQVKLISVDLDSSVANVEYNGLMVPLELGAAPVNTGRNTRGRTTTTTARNTGTATANTTTTTTRRFNNGFQPTTTTTTATQPPMPPTTMTMPTMNGNDGGMPAMMMDFGGGGMPAGMDVEDLRSRMQQQGGAGGRPDRRGR
ncbi:MAG: hypothetical protein JXR40_13030 [Pontiellaceae bacterium]|nr:hypothetical protein [Pontiellaceae bacterium]